MSELFRNIFAIVLTLLLSVSFPLSAEEEVDATDEEIVVEKEKADTEKPVVEETECEGEACESEESEKVDTEKPVVEETECEGEACESEESEKVDTEKPVVEETECEGEACESEELEGEEGYDSEEVEEEKPPALESLTIKHQIGDEELPAKTIAADLMVLLQTLKEDIIAQTEKQTKPFTVKTEVTGVWAEEFADSWGKLPPLAIITEIDKESKGESIVTLPAFNKVLPDPSREDEEEATVDWKGLQGQLTFAEKFADLKFDLTMQGLIITEKAEEGKEAPTFNVEKTTLKGEFDADLLPIALAFNLPSLRLLDGDVQMIIQSVSFEGKMKPLEQGIELSTGEFKVKQLQLTDKGKTSIFKDFEIKGDGNVEKEGVIYKINTQIGNVTMPKEVIDNLTDINLSYVGNLELRRLDTESVKQLQQTARNLQKQQHSGEIPSDMVGLTWFAKLTELAPTLLAKSPELALTQLKLITEDGKLDGKIVMSIDGKKGASLEDFSSLMNALQVQADFNMTKVLLEKTMTTIMTNLQVKEGSDEKEALKEAQAFTEKQIKGYIEQKLLKEAGDNYELSATFKESKSTINGQEMPLPF